MHIAAAVRTTLRNQMADQTIPNKIVSYTLSNDTKDREHCENSEGNWKPLACGEATPSTIHSRCPVVQV